MLTLPARMLAAGLARALDRRRPKRSPRARTACRWRCAPRLPRPWADDDEHRPEDFLAGDRHVVGDVGKDGRAGHRSPCQRLPAPGPPATSVAPSWIPCGSSRALVPLAAETRGPIVVLAGEGVAGLKSWRATPAIAPLPSCLARHDHPRQRVAGLSGIVEHVLTPPTTALVRSASSRMTFADLPPSSWLTRFTVARPLGNVDAGAGRAGEGDHVDVGVAGMAAPTSGPRPLMRLNTPFGTPASCRMSARIKAQRREFAGLEDHRAAGGERGRDLAGDLVQRVVPRA